MTPIYVASTSPRFWWTADGTIGNPYYGGSRERLEALLMSQPEGQEINFLAGEYYLGPSGESAIATWAPKSWIFKGAGIDKTIIKLVGVTTQGRHNLFSNQYVRDFDGLVIQDMTFDCDLANQPNTTNICLQGISVSGSNITIQRVRIIGWGTTKTLTECFPLQLFQWNTIEPMHNVFISECRVDAPFAQAHADGATLISVSQAAVGASCDLTCRIIDCVADLKGFTGLAYGNAFGAPVVERCISYNVSGGTYSDYWNQPVLIVRNCQFVDCRFGIYYVGTSTFTHGMVIGQNNFIQIKAGTVYAVPLRHETPSTGTPFNQVIWHGNVLKADAAGSLPEGTISFIGTAPLYQDLQNNVSIT